MNTTEQNAYRQARKHVNKLKKFYKHLVVYIVINIFLAGLNLYQNPQHLWCLSFSVGGLGLALDAVSVFLPDVLFSKQ